MVEFFEAVEVKHKEAHIMSEEKKVVAEVEEETPVAVVAPTMASVVHDPNEIGRAHV